MEEIISDKKLNDFLKELSILTLKYQIEIAGCGCCGSPSLEDFNHKKFEDGYIYKTCLSFNHEKNIYEVDGE